MPLEAAQRIKEEKYQPPGSSWCHVCSRYSAYLDEAQGNTVCQDCGIVLEENHIVSTIEFSETNGGSAVVGQFVSSATTKPFGSRGRGGGNAKYGMSSGRAPRDATIQKGCSILMQIQAHALLQGRFSAQAQERAKRCLTLAVRSGFCQGRKYEAVAGACAYIACRELSIPILLLDISDVISVNVFLLGDCYRKLVSQLYYAVEPKTGRDPALQPMYSENSNDSPIRVVDPALYVERFGKQLNFGDKRVIVINTAARIVARMDREWLVQGRRPTGICGAALVIASRVHGCERSIEEVRRLIKCCHATVRQRMREFASTESAQLSIDALAETVPQGHRELAAGKVPLGGNVESSGSNPPSFNRARMAETASPLTAATAALKRQRDEAARSSENEGSNNNGGSTKNRATKKRKGKGKGNARPVTPSPLPTDTDGDEPEPEETEAENETDEENGNNNGGGGGSSTSKAKRKRKQKRQSTAGDASANGAAVEPATELRRSKRACTVNTRYFEQPEALLDSDDDEGEGASAHSSGMGGGETSVSEASGAESSEDDESTSDDSENDRRDARNNNNRNAAKTPAAAAKTPAASAAAAAAGAAAAAATGETVVAPLPEAAVDGGKGRRFGSGKGKVNRRHRGEAQRQRKRKKTGETVALQRRHTRLTASIAERIEQEDALFKEIEAELDDELLLRGIALPADLTISGAHADCSRNKTTAAAAAASADAAEEEKEGPEDEIGDDLLAGAAAAAALSGGPNSEENRVQNGNENLGQEMDVAGSENGANEAASEEHAAIPAVAASVDAAGEISGGAGAAKAAAASVEEGKAGAAETTTPAAEEASAAEKTAAAAEKTAAAAPTAAAGEETEAASPAEAAAAEASSTGAAELNESDRAAPVAADGAANGAVGSSPSKRSNGGGRRSNKGKGKQPVPLRPKRVILLAEMRESDSEGDVSDVNDNEISSYLLGEDEAKWKDETWARQNEKYLHDKGLKDKAEEERKAAGGAIVDKKKKKKGAKKTNNGDPNAAANGAGLNNNAAAAEQAGEGIAGQKRLSKKIDYSKWQQMFGGGSEDANDNVHNGGFSGDYSGGYSGGFSGGFGGGGAGAAAAKRGWQPPFSIPTSNKRSRTVRAANAAVAGLVAAGYVPPAAAAALPSHVAAQAAAAAAASRAGSGSSGGGAVAVPGAQALTQEAGGGALANGSGSERVGARAETILAAGAQGPEGDTEQHVQVQVENGEFVDDGSEEGDYSDGEGGVGGVSGAGVAGLEDDEEEDNFEEWA